MVYIKSVFLCLVTLLLWINMAAQNSVGLIAYDADKVFDGYTLIYPFNQPNVYLLNNCGQVVHEWIDSTQYRPTASVYLLENGDLLKTKKLASHIPGTFTSGGAGGIIELLTWDNQLIWSKKIVDTEFRAHHDVELLPNGNVLIIVWQKRLRDEFIEAGGDTTLFDRQEIWPDIIQEYNPALDSVVWVWDAWDHLVQDFDSTKENYGDIASHPGKINLNYDIGVFGGRPDWIHSNAIDYNEDLDQILLSASHFEEIWFIDHSTTPEEVKGDTGGNFGKGGELLFRWGNPRAYNKGNVDDQKLFFQHDVQWIDDPDLENSEYYRQIGLFNNRIESNKSSIDVLKPVLNIELNEYITQSGTYLPSSFNLTIQSSEESQFQSSNMSSMQLLPNGNYLICAAQRGRVIEITDDNQVVWDYILPFRNGARVIQGTDLNIGDNVVFRAKKYGANYAAFVGKELFPEYYLELNANEEFCNLSVHTNEMGTNGFNVYPIPANDFLYVKSEFRIINNIEIYNSFGQKIEQINNLHVNDISINTSKYPQGLYYIKLNKSSMYKVLIIN